jgi:peptidyl-prolyl cis-trans isomerase A (cyclophilin A)
MKEEKTSGDGSAWPCYAGPMTSKWLLAAALCAAAFPLSAQTGPSVEPGPPDTATAPVEDLVPVVLDTDAGRIVIALDRGHAPVTSANFLKYVDGKRYDGQTFYRALKMGDGGLIQGGVRNDARKLLPPIAHEPTSQTGLKNVAGSIVMANAGPGTARSDFFILLSDTPAFDAGNPQGDANGFAVFGRVVEGMDVVRKILDSPVSDTKGEGVMKGQMLEPEVRIVTARRVAQP